MKTYASAILFFFLCFCVKKENPNPLVEKQAFKKRDSTERAVFVSGFSRWRVLTTNLLRSSEKDSVFVEIFVNGTFKMAYLMLNDASKLMLYYGGEFVGFSTYNYSPCSNESKSIVVFSSKVGDSIRVKAIYKPFTLF